MRGNRKKSVGPKLLLSALMLLLLLGRASAQKVDSIYFHLYTDSLKKGFYNYINVDGRLANGEWLPLDSTQIRFQASTGRFRGNDLFIDRNYGGDTVRVRAELKSNPAVWKEVVIYIRRRALTL